MKRAEAIATGTKGELTKPHLLMRLMSCDCCHEFAAVLPSFSSASPASTVPPRDCSSQGRWPHGVAAAPRARSRQPKRLTETHAEAFLFAERAAATGAVANRCR